MRAAILAGGAAAGPSGLGLWRGRPGLDPRPVPGACCPGGGSWGCRLGEGLGKAQGRLRAGCPGLGAVCPGLGAAAACVQLSFPPALAPEEGMSSGARPEPLRVARLTFNVTAQGSSRGVP